MICNFYTEKIFKKNHVRKICVQSNDIKINILTDIKFIPCLFYNDVNILKLYWTSVLILEIQKNCSVKKVLGFPHQINCYTVLLFLSFLCLLHEVHCNRA